MSSDIEGLDHLVGDEYGQTRNGNNNWYGHDTRMTRFEWDELEKVQDSFFRFYRYEAAHNALCLLRGGGSCCRLGCSGMFCTTRDLLPILCWPEAVFKT